MNFIADSAGDPRTIAILDEQIAALEQLVAVLRALKRRDYLIGEIELSARLANCLRRNLYPPAEYLSQVAAMSKLELLRTPNFWHVCYFELWEVCVSHGFWDRDDPAYRPHWPLPKPRRGRPTVAD
jgi:hypothetical protein